MRWHRNMKIGNKIVGGFLIVALVAGIIGGLGIRNIWKIDNLDTELYETMTVPLGEMIAITESYHAMRGNAKDALLAEDNSRINEYESRIADRNEEFTKNLNSYETTLFSEEGQNLVPQLRRDKETYDELVARGLSQLRAGDRPAAINTIEVQAEAARVDIENTISRLTEIKLESANNAMLSNTATARASTVQTGVILAIGVISAIGIGMYTGSSIKKPINELLLASEKIAGGDLRVDINTNGKDEVGQLARAFSTMADNVNEVMSEINVSSDQVSTGSVQVAQSSQELSQGSTEQASSVEQITSSVQELSAQTIQNADNANEAREIAEKAQSDAEAGNEKMKEMLSSMNEINESSEKISKIIKVIDEIAFQTNILALNAAVEAARAGQHGKGFAVVAEEVRNLAARSANAAKETTEMIESSIYKTERGTEMAEETAKALDEIIEEVEKVGKYVAEIAEASNEQATGIEQVNEAIVQVSEVVQNNSATSQEVAAASEELSSQAELLKKSVLRFKLKGGNGSSSNFDDLSSDMLDMFGDDKDGSSSKFDLSDDEFGRY